MPGAEAGHAKPNRNRIRQLCAAVPFSAIEDPCETPFTECMAFFGGSFVVFPGGAPGGTSRLKLLLRAIFLNQPELLPANFRNFVHYAALALLTVSDATAERAGLDRHAAPVSRPGAAVDVPSAARFEEAKRWPVWQPASLTSLLNPIGIGPEALEPFVVDCGSQDLSTIEEQGKIFNRQPLVRLGDDIIVAAPGRLQTALTNAILEQAVAYGVIADIAGRYTRSCWRNVVHSLRLLGHRRLAFNQDPPSVDCYHEGLFSLDTDKAIFVQLACDDLMDYQESSDIWSPTKLTEVLDHQAERAKDLLFSTAPPCKDVLFLTLLSSPGRSFVTGGNSMPLSLLLQPDELETIADVESGDDLALLRYAKASNELRATCPVFVFSQLDEYELFREHRYSYYLSDNRRPTFLSVMPGWGLGLRLAAHDRRDWHSVPSHDGDSYVEVTCLHDDRQIPLYVPLSGRRWSICVESLPQVVWVVSRHDKGQAPSIYPELLETVAYWIWQMGSAFAPALSQCSEGLTVWLDLDSPESWFADEGEPMGADDGIEIICMPSADGDFAITLHLAPGFRTMLQGPDNSGERVLVRHILSGFSKLCEARGLAALSPLSIDELVDEYAPLGVKKKMLFFGRSDNPDINSSNIPRYRKVHDYEDGVILDEAGRFLSSTHVPGPIPDAERTGILNSLVAHLYKELQEVVAVFQPAPLLAWLIAHNESLTNQVGMRRLTIPTRIACFALQDKIISELRKELPQANRAAVASRFLIEYVAARRPSGSELPSYESYDRLMALAAAIIGFGTDSDLIRYQISDFKLAILESQRLGISRGNYSQAGESYTTSSTEAEVRQASQAYDHHWPEAYTEVNESGKDEVNEAFLAEFGYTLTDHAMFIGELLNLGWTIEKPQKQFSAAAVFTHVMQALGWDQEKVRRLLASLSLTERPDFLKPQSPALPEDVYPWRFNRALSYVRRPLILWGKKSAQEVWWGNRHLYTSARNLVHLFQSGRLKADSPEMRKVVGRRRELEGRGFNDQVAEIVERSGNAKALRRVGKVGGLRLGSPDEDLGDIDVFAVNAKKNSLLLIECKNLNVARTPWEFSSELTTLFRGDEDQESVVERHSRRVDWVAAHLSEAAVHFGIPLRKFKVEGVIVLDEESFTAQLFAAPKLPVLSRHAFEFEWLPKWINR